MHLGFGCFLDGAGHVDGVPVKAGHSRPEEACPLQRSSLLWGTCLCILHVTRNTR